MQIMNGTRLCINATQSTDKHQKTHMLVVAKATYSFSEQNNQTLELASSQEDIYDSDIFEGEPGLSSPYFESDWAYYKPYCDVIVKGSAHAPEGHQVTNMGVAIRINECFKKIKIIGNRYWEKKIQGLRLSAAEPFTKMPITYSRSYGGTWHSDEDSKFNACFADNPIGRGFAHQRHKSYLVNKLSFNIAPVNYTGSRRHHSAAPISFGPIGRGWPSRAKYAGTYDEHWKQHVFPLWPADFDERFFQTVPTDQQIAYPKGGDKIELWNMHPQRRHMIFYFPNNLDLPLAVITQDRKATAIKTVVDTIAIDTDRQIIMLVWRGRFPLKRSLREVHTLASGYVCKSWWNKLRYGTNDYDCDRDGSEDNEEDTITVTEAIKL